MINLSSKYENRRERKKPRRSLRAKYENCRERSPEEQTSAPLRCQV